MMRIRPAVRALAAVLLVGLLGCSSQPQTAGTATAAAKAPAPPGQAHAFRGRVEKVDVPARSVLVAGENVEGWMGAMTMPYEIQPPEMLEKLAAGDQITATVYDGDVRVLHEVKIAPPAPPKS
jgi:Cu/Ag efflux protein CusF